MASSFQINFADLQRILANIKIAERDAAGENLLAVITEIATGSPAIAGATFVNAANLPLGLRRVDGSYNHLIPGSPNGFLTGAADQSFARLVAPSYISATGTASLDLDPRPATTLLVNNSSYEPSYEPGAPNQNAPEIHRNSLVDASVRTISNLIVDQTVTNPAAIASALRLAGHEDPDGHALSLYEQARVLLDPAATEQAQAGARLALMDDLAASGVTVSSDGSIVVEHRSADIGLSPANSSWMTIFGQFFDHGLDLLAKGRQGTVYIPLQPDDPLYVEGSSSNFMALTRATGSPGNNLITPWIDQNQTYTSHPSHQVFLREYQRIDRQTGDLLNDPTQPEWEAGLTVATGRLLNGADGGVPTWADVKAHALTYLGIALDDRDVLKIPQVLTDPYGRFIAGPNGYAQLLAVDAAGQSITVEGTAAGLNPTELNAIRIAQAFLDDINRSAVPVIANAELQPDADMAVGGAEPNGRGGFTTYDNELLDAHYVTGDGRGNENIALTAIHSVFHSEHNRVLEANKLTILRSGDLEGINEWLRVPLADTVALSSAQASDADLSALAAGLQWDGERLFQAAKFSTEMQYQHLVFEEFARRIQPNIAPFVFTNSADLDARIVAEFAHTVYRFGHSQLGDGVARLDADLASRDLGLIDSFLNPLEFANSGLDAEAATGAIARGITRVVDQEIDEFIVEALRNNLLGAPLDLASLNLARGRELGIPSLNETRAQLYAMTGAVQLKPYTGWTVDPNQADSHGFFQHLKNPMSVVNLIAAYGTHPAITEATNIDAKRLAAMAIVFNTPLDGSAEPPAHALDFLRGTGVYADQETGINAVDLWIGGLAERVNEFGGQLGDTFNAVFQYQMEQLQNGDRFYYLSRTQGMNLLTQLEATTFSDLVMRNSDLGDPHATHLSAHIMGVPDLILELDLKAAQANYSGDGSLDGLVGSTNTAQQRASLDPTSPALFDFLLGGAANSKVMRSYGIEDRNGDGFVDGNVLRFTGGEHVVLGGTEGNDAIYGDKGIDTLWGDGGDDYLNAGMESDQVFGGDGDDIIVDPFGADFLRGEAGDDVIVNGAGLDVDFGGSGQDAMFAVVDTTEMFGGEDNDFMRGGSAPDLLMGGEGDDWIEGGEGFDSIAGDNSELFFNSPIVGHDIMNGQGNDTDYDGENGDDIMVQGAGIQRNNGMEGFDWAIHKGDPVAADTDLTPQIPGLVEIPDAALAVILRDRFDSVEGVSGWKYDDYLRGSVRSIDQNPWFENQLTQAGVDRIHGLRAVLGGVALDDPDAVVFGDLNINGNSGSQIFLGGDGSDTIMGGVGDDVIDGDAWLNVRLTGVRRDGSSFSVDSLSELFTDLVSGLIDPGGMVAVREILYDDRVDGINPEDVNLDVAVFQDLRQNYDIILGADGAVTVSHLTVSDGLQSDGMDRLRNIEVARFADQDLRLVNDPPMSSGLLATTELSTSGFFGFFGAANRVGLAAPALFDANNVTAENPLGLVDSDSVSVSFFDATDPATALPLTAAGELELAATSGRQLSMTASYVDAVGFTNTFESSIFNTIVGTALSNTLTGTAGLDYLFGGAGADVLLGNGGDDYLSGGVDADLLNGGDGIDIANFAGVATSLGNAANPPAQAVVDARFGLNGANLTVSTPTGGLDTLVSIERLRFSDGIFDLVAGATSSADDLTYTGDQRALLFGASGDDNLRGGVDDDIFTYTAAGTIAQNAISGGGRDRIDGGANRELGDRLVIQGDNTTETFRVIAVAGDANAARRAELSAAGFTAIADSAEIVILRGTGVLDALPPLATTSFAVIAEVTAIEELTINVSGVGPAGTQRVQIIGDFTPTSLRTNTITVSSDGAGAEVDVSSLESVHRVVLDAGTILGQRSQDVVQTMMSAPMSSDSTASDSITPDTHVLIGLPAVDPADAADPHVHAHKADPHVHTDECTEICDESSGPDALADVVGKALHLGLSLHKLPDFTSDDPNELVLRPFGSQAERSAQFYLMLTAESLRDASIDTLDVTFELGDDFLNVFELSGEQIFFSEDLAVQRRVQLDGSTLRFEGAGLGALGAGHGVSEKAPIAVIALTPREDLDEQIVAERLADRYGFSNSESWQQSLQFSVSANVHEILFSDLLSLGDLGGEAALLTDELQLIARAAQVDLWTDDDFALGTERQVLKPGEGGFSNLIRSGDTLERTTHWRNDGEFTLHDLAITDLHQAGVATSKSWIVDGLDALDVGATAEITTEFHVHGAAGSVLDSAALGFQIDASGGYHWDTADMAQFQQKNLITYQADLNYDGRVSMKDLAFLNAGVSRGYSRDVDANYDGALDINDLAVIDAEWGQSLHQGEGQFLGSGSMSMTDLSQQGMHQWDSSAFMGQNAIEAEQQVPELVAESTGTLITAQGFDALVTQLEQQQSQQYDMT